MRSLFVAAACALAVAGAGAAEEQPDEKLDVPPSWVRQPTPGDIMGVFPREALKKGRSGKATIECEIAVDGVLRKCSVFEETPANAGFGGAALALASQFVFNPGMKNGKPVPSTVRIPLRFKPGGPRSRGDELITVLSRVPWAAAPTRADMAKAFPAKADIEGHVVLDCVFKADGTLTGCIAQKEEPRGKGFAAAARAVATKFRGPTQLDDGKSIRGAHTLVPIHFDLPHSAPDVGGARIGKPDWSGLPEARDFDAVYPAKAKAGGVKTGVGRVDCAVAPGGRLTDCKPLSEEPAGVGFGEAALKVAPMFVLTPWTTDGRPVDGARVRVPIRFVYPEAPLEDTKSSAPKP